MKNIRSLTDELSARGVVQLSLGRYRITGARNEKGFFIDVKGEGTKLMPFDKAFSDTSDLPSAIVNLVRRAETFEYYLENREILNLKEGWSIEYSRVNFLQQGKLDSILHNQK